MFNHMQLNLQLFADEGEGGEGGGGAQGGAQGQQQPSGNQGEQSIEQFVAAALEAVEARRQRVGEAVIKSFAEQYGMTADELKEAIAAENAKRNQQIIEEEVRSQIDTINKSIRECILKTEITQVGAAMGLLDPDLAMLLIDKKRVAINDDNTVEGVQDELEKLQKDMPYLFKLVNPSPLAQNRQGGAPYTNTNTPSTLRSALRERLFGGDRKSVV